MEQSGCCSQNVVQSSSQVVSHARLHQPSNNKRKGKREIRPGLDRRRRQELRAFDGRTIAHKARHGNSGEDSKLDRVAYIGEHKGLKCFKVVFTDGSTGEFSAVEIRNRLMPE